MPQLPVERMPSPAFTASRRVHLSPVLVAVVMLGMLVLGDQLVFGSFVSARLVSNLFLDTSYLLALSVGMTFVILSGGIDLSIGSVIGLGGVIGAQLLAAGVPAGIAIPLVVAAGAGIGLVNGVLVAAFDVQPIVATLAGMFLARGLAYTVSLNAVAIRDSGLNALTLVSVGVGDLQLSLGVIAALALAVAAYLLLHRTRFGRTVFAIGGNADGARLMGLAVMRTTVLVYVVSGVCAGIAAVLFASYTSSGDPQAGVGMELAAIAAVVIGGTTLGGGHGGVVGTVIGVLVYGVIQLTIDYLGVDPWWTPIVLGLLLLVFVVAQRLAASRSAVLR
ncbi:sugar ABC transporter permease YjfF [Planctomonas sp. JC2975]|uniref:ABC transporter permease subunit n=1 Tax=Planctomonas sp. JC2975 TaxID=2729626 RepID=UPI001F0DE8FD|nr:sugar ABC transporter permease YjfF [Planctomonas sp. JC2975]